MKSIFLAFLIFSVVQYGQTAMVATANIHVDSTSVGIGTILFHQDDPQESVRIVGIIDGLKPNTVHGFHVHRDPLPDTVFICNASGPHFNPETTLHGPRLTDIQHRHVGDLGNITADENGIIIIQIEDRIIDLFNSNRSIANRTIVIHAMRDDGGHGGFPDSNTTGNAGPRIACGVISAAQLETSATLKPWRITTTIYDFIRKLFS